MSDIDIVFPSKLDKRSKKPQGVPGTISKRTAQKRTKTIKLSNIQTNKLTNKLSNNLTNKHSYIQSFLEEKAGGPIGFRVPTSLEEKLEEIIGLATVLYKVKLKKQEIFIVALAFIFWDFEVNGKKSILYKKFAEKSNK